MATEPLKKNLSLLVTHISYLATINTHPWLPISLILPNSSLYLATHLYSSTQLPISLT
jgi:hypothetical protein